MYTSVYLGNIECPAIKNVAERNWNMLELNKSIKIVKIQNERMQVNE